MANKTYARIDGGKIVEIITLDAAIQINKAFVSSLTFVDITSVAPQPTYGWSYSGGTFAAPAAETLAALQAAQVAAVDLELSSIIGQPWKYNGVGYQIDAGSQANITSMGALAAAILSNVPGAAPWPVGFYWISADNSQQPMTAAQMFAFAQAVAGHVSALILYARALKDRIAATTTSTALSAIDITAGWPA